MRLFVGPDERAVENRMAALVRYAADQANAELAVVTCSAARGPMLQRVASNTGIAVLKIDEPLAREAVAHGSRVGVLVTFASSREAAESLLRDAAIESGATVELDTLVIPEAYTALLSGDVQRHDELVIEAGVALSARNRCVVLSQISMARVAAKIASQSHVPVLDALNSSLTEVRSRFVRQ
ncbi:MAG: aspartate/glutamate racemase family protein [Acidobacteriota bacterium]